MITEREFLKQGFGKNSPWLDLVNSEEWDGLGHFTDHLQTPGWLSSFLRHWNLLSPSASPHSLEQIRILRSVLRHAAENLAARHELSARDFQELNAAMDVPARQALIRGATGFETRLVPAKLNWNWILSRIAASFAAMLAQTPLERLKVCANSPGCRWVFYDVTKGNTRRWCSDRTCGNRYRVRQARARGSKLRRALRL
jgi:predicted RNA-binding Zn ribbon-like protein